MTRAFLTKLHLIMAAFMFPAVLMFLGTGVLYTWGNTGEWHEEKVEVALEQSLVDEGGLRAVALAELTKRELGAPSGKAKTEGEGGDLKLSWPGARSEVVVAATDNPALAEVTIKQASLHRWLVQLHKAKGSTVFKAYASFLALTLFVLVASGLLIGFRTPALRRLTALSSTVGFVAFVGFVLLG